MARPIKRLQAEPAVVENLRRRSRARTSMVRERERAEIILLRLEGLGVAEIPPQASSAFVAAMEDILAVYKRPHDGECPLVCLDETSKQLLADRRAPIPMKPGHPARRDDPPSKWRTPLVSS